MDLKTRKSLHQLTFSQSVLRANCSGIIHINDAVKDLKKVDEGVVLAQIYPILHLQTKIAVVTYIPTEEIGAIKKRKTLRWHVHRNQLQPLKLSGKVVEIDSSPTYTTKGNFFKVIAHSKLTPRQASEVRYGMQGEAVVILGEKTWFSLL